MLHGRKLIMGRMRNMSDYQCLECGEVFDSEQKNCPNCGCPVEKTVSQEQDAKKEFKVNIFDKNPQNIKQYCSIAISIVIVIIGIFIAAKSVKVDNYTASSYQVEDYEFGPDFYTQIYQATGTAAKELNDINGGIQSLSSSINAGIKAIYTVSGTIIIAIGLGTIAVSLNLIKNNKKEEEKTAYGIN